MCCRRVGVKGRVKEDEEPNVVPTLLRKTKARPRALCQEKRKMERSETTGLIEKETATEKVTLTVTWTNKFPPG